MPNALREDNRTEDDIETGKYRDSDIITYNPNCTLSEQGRAEIARVMNEYFAGGGLMLSCSTITLVIRFRKMRMSTA